MASTTILAALLIATWFSLTLLILILALAVFYFKETYKIQLLLMHQPKTPILNQTPEWPSNGVQESDDSLLEFLDKGDFQYPIGPLPNVTHHPFLIPGPLESSHNDAIILYQFPGPLEVSQDDSGASTGSYYAVPIQFFPSSLAMSISSSPGPDLLPADSLTPESPSMPPLTSDISDNGSLAHAPNLQLLADVSEYIMASEGGSTAVTLRSL
ncbi:uncharacterized protein FIBRA_09337 [Fibroporia radiculosa]|uniref:Uncharacterized protein n=1 Tax=Fibroporia radiculosa TaxID=599839 RepID=J7SCY3_9APHY|nr:uncharacterized protein FIBRA_09337 [Fibroporia radiculosa]CCM07018.1 predicted protein [Fibroporia radiculosa]